jgi:hypothetical protein
MKSCLHGLKREHALAGELIFVRSSIIGSRLIIAAFSVPVHDVDGLVPFSLCILTRLVPRSAAHAIPGRAETFRVQQLLVQ